MAILQTDILSGNKLGNIFLHKGDNLKKAAVKFHSILSEKYFLIKKFNDGKMP